MQEDERCCGTGTCIIDAQGRCWCGQVWNGQTMCHPSEVAARAASGSAKPAPQQANTPLPDARA